MNTIYCLKDAINNLIDKFEDKISVKINNKEIFRLIKIIIIVE